MTNTNEFSDSQESVLFGDEVYNELKKEIGYPLPILPEDLEDQFEEKYDTAGEQKYQGNAKRIKEDEKDDYFPGEVLDPIKEEFPGHLNFQLILNNERANKHWMYSQTLKKVFINIGQTLTVRFKWEPAVDGLYLRTAMLFSLDQYRNDPVHRCHNHMAPTDHTNQDINPTMIKHVVRCLDPLSVYHDTDGHLSIVTPLRRPQPGTQYVPMYFQFMCKNSCTSGMNRRPTELIFTLEDHRRVAVGRRKLLVRVCSCPKRDKEKEEGEEGKMYTGSLKRKLPPSTGKKMVMSSCDTHVFKVQLDIVGKENYLAVLKYAHDVMAGQAMRTGKFEVFQPYMDEILRSFP